MICVTCLCDMPQPPQPHTLTTALTDHRQTLATLQGAAGTPKQMVTGYATTYFSQRFVDLTYVHLLTHTPHYTIPRVDAQNEGGRVLNDRGTVATIGGQVDNYQVLFVILPSLLSYSLLFLFCISLLFFSFSLLFCLTP